MTKTELKHKLLDEVYKLVYTCNHPQIRSEVEYDLTHKKPTFKNIAFNKAKLLRHQQGGFL